MPHACREGTTELLALGTTADSNAIYSRRVQKGARENETPKNLASRAKRSLLILFVCAHQALRAFRDVSTHLVLGHHSKTHLTAL